MMQSQQQGARYPLLPAALDAPRRVFVNTAGWRCAYYADGPSDGRALVLIHSVNAAPSSYEFKPLFEHYRHSRPVYSLDLPGFGHSDRRARGYSPELMAHTIEDFLRQLDAGPADVVALSLGAEFAVRAAFADPQRFASLTLVSPTGFSSRTPPGPFWGQLLHRLLTLPGLGAGLYRLVSSRASIRYYLGRSFVGDVPADALDYAHVTSHQPGARHAPLAFLSGRLFTPDAPARLYGRLSSAIPVLAIADRDPYIDFAALEPFVAAHPSWHFERLAPHFGLPHWDRPKPTWQMLDAFWAQSR